MNEERVVFGRNSTVQRFLSCYKHGASARDLFQCFSNRVLSFSMIVMTVREDTIVDLICQLFTHKLAKEIEIDF